MMFRRSPSSLKRVLSDSALPDKECEAEQSIPNVVDSPSPSLDGGKIDRPKRYSYLLPFASYSVLWSLLFSVLVLSGCLLWSMAQTVDPCARAEMDFRAMKNGKPRLSPALDDQQLEFPKIIHQQWKTSDIPEGSFSKWHQRWLELYPEPEFKHMLWTDESMRALIRDEYPWFLEVYDSYEFGIQRADAVRYFILHSHGGLYADLDYEPLVNFWDRIPKDRVSLNESPYKYYESRQNSLMASPKGDPFWNKAFDVLIELRDKSVLEATGPAFLDSLLEVQTEDYYLLPCENFSRIPFIQETGEASPLIHRLGQHTFGRFYPMKYCGEFTNPTCQFGKHHNSVSYLSDTGVARLVYARRR